MGILGGIIGGIGGFLAGGPVGAAAGVIGGLGLGGDDRDDRRSPFDGRTGGFAGPIQAGPGAGRAFPSIPALAPQQVPVPRRPPITINPPFGGAPGVGIGFFEPQTAAPAPFQQGMPMIGPTAINPASAQRVVRQCPSGYRLAIDGLCYPKALLGKTSKLRAWPATPAAPITRADVKALNRIDSVRKKVRTMAGKADLACRKK